MLCPKCGQTISETAVFCENCGASITMTAPTQSPAAIPAKSIQETPTQMQRTTLTSPRYRLLVLIGCAVAFAGIFMPWLAVTTPTVYRASVWDCIIGREYGENGLILFSLHPPHYLWLVPVGAFAALVGAAFMLVLPRMKAPWFAILAGTVAAIVGAICAFPGQEWYVSQCLCMFTETYQYGIFITLAGSVVGALGGLISLFLVTQVHRREASPSP